MLSIVDEVQVLVVGAVRPLVAGVVDVMDGVGDLPKKNI